MKRRMRGRNEVEKGVVGRVRIREVEVLCNVW